MNNQQTPLFSVIVNKVDFVPKALKAYTHYSSKTIIKRKDQEESEKWLLSLYGVACRSSLGLSKDSNRYAELQKRILNHNANIDNFQNTQRVMNIINMVSISPDEFVTVTEDIYKLIYKCE